MGDRSARSNSKVQVVVLWSFVLCTLPPDGYIMCCRQPGALYVYDGASHNCMKVVLYWLQIEDIAKYWQGT